MSAIADADILEVVGLLRVRGHSRPQPPYVLLHTKNKRVATPEPVLFGDILRQAYPIPEEACQLYIRSPLNMLLSVLREILTADLEGVTSQVTAWEGRIATVTRRWKRTRDDTYFHKIFMIILSIVKEMVESAKDPASFDIVRQVSVACLVAWWFGGDAGTKGHVEVFRKYNLVEDEGELAKWWRVIQTIGANIQGVGASDVDRLCEVWSETHSYFLRFSTQIKVALFTEDDCVPPGGSDSHPCLYVMHNSSSLPVELLPLTARDVVIASDVADGCFVDGIFTVPSQRHS